MIGHWLQIFPAAAIGNAEGMKAYIADMHRISLVLATPAPAFSWWTAFFLILVLVAWCALLTTAWLLLNRRIDRPLRYRGVNAEFALRPDSGAIEPASSQPSAYLRMETIRRLFSPSTDPMLRLQTCHVTEPHSHTAVHSISPGECS